MLQISATRHVEKQPERKPIKKPDIRAIPVRLICDNCHKEFEIKYSTQNARIHKGRPNLCNKCMRSYKSELHSAKMKGEDSWWNSLSQEEQQRRMELCWKENKNYHQSMSDDEKQRLLDKRINGYHQWLDSLTPEEKTKRYEYLIACLQEYCSNMSVDDKLEMSKRISDASKKYWQQFDEETRKQMMQPVQDGRVKWCNSLSEQERIERSKHATEGFIKYWNSLDDEQQYERLIKLHDGAKEWRDNLSDSEKQLLIENLSNGRDRWWNSLTDEEKRMHMLNCLKNFEIFRQNLTVDVFDDIMCNNAVRSNAKQSTIMRPNKNEDALIDQFKLYRLPFIRYYYNTTKHESFHELFPFNSVTGSKFVSPYHCWDFKLELINGDVLVDIDGSIHDASKTDVTGTLPTGQLVNISEYVEFNDSKRPYQTDGLPAYIVKCLDDNLSDETPVVNLNTGEIMTFKSFIAILRFINMNNKERRDVVKCLN